LVLAISKQSVGDSSPLIISVLEIMAAVHRAVGFTYLDSSEETSKPSPDKASAIKFFLPFIYLISGPNSSISKRQRITLSEVSFAYVNFL
jgi:hypothetical protein